MKPTIIPGYKGIMPLDLSGVDPKYHENMIKQHHEDIKEYQEYQDTLPKKLKYENTTEKAMNLLKKDREWLARIANKNRLEEIEKDKKYYEGKIRYLQYQQFK